MSAFGVVLIGLGILTSWAGYKRVLVTDVLKTFIGASGPPPKTV